MKMKKALKKLLAVFVALLLTGAVIFLPSTLLTPISSSFCISQHTENPPKLIAHRGFSGVYPQNTEPAFSGAVEMGYWGMECDIHTTKDGKWVVIHDDEISNLTNGEGLVKDLTFEEIQKIQMDTGNGIENYGALPIPTLEEYLDIALEGEIVPVIEIKNCDTELLPSLKEILDKYELSETSVIISFNEEYLTKYREIDKNITMFLLINTPTVEKVDFCIENNFGVNFNHKCLYKSTKALKHARENNVPIAAWTVDNTVYADIMTLFGADFITTNKIIP